MVTALAGDCPGHLLAYSFTAEFRITKGYELFELSGLECHGGREEHVRDEFPHDLASVGGVYVRVVG